MAAGDTERGFIAAIDESLSVQVRRLRSRPAGKWLLLFPSFVIIALLLILPAIVLLDFSFNQFVGGQIVGGFTLEHYTRAIFEDFYQTIFVRTVRIALVVTVLDFLLGFPLAYAAVREGGWKAKLIVISTLAPLTIDLVVRSFGWFVLLSDSGLVVTALGRLGLVSTANPPELLFNETGIIIGLTHVMLPFMVFPIMNVLQTIPPSYEEAARNLGASRFTVFRTVLFPLALPGISAGVLITFIVSMAAYVTPAILGGGVKVVPVIITETFLTTSNWPFASALSMLLVVIALVVIVGYHRVLGIIEGVGGA